MEETLLVIVAARNEADRIGATLDALAAALPGAELWVADDASEDRTSEVALTHGAQVVSRGRPHGKGANMTAAAEAALGGVGGAGADRGSEAASVPAGTVLLCDGDLGASAGALRGLVDAVDRGECDLAIAAFRDRVGGGFGVALRFARWAIRSRCGYRAGAPISGQRAMRVEVLRATLPFAAGYGMEVGMTIDAVRAGHRVVELELDLEHRATGRTVRDFLHRARQLRDFAGVWWSRR
ncbi:MAG: glycosyltransferase [Solirubrobacterales bacterium]|nr:glycosyltransferase [Solirubrobacterales bacterium]